MKAGGHAAFRGASNIEGGVTIDLANLNQITLSADKSQVSLGPGNRWLDVYTKLERHGLSVVGGRIEDIGVGGLTLGGGISYFSARYGFASDNVLAFQVCLVDLSLTPRPFLNRNVFFWRMIGLTSGIIDRLRRWHHP